MRLPLYHPYDHYRAEHDEHETHKDDFQITLGNFFAYVVEAPVQARPARLRPKVPLHVKREVHAILNEEVRLPGLTLKPRQRPLVPLAGLSTDRDLYRADEDTVYVHVTMPGKQRKAQLSLGCHGETVSERTLDLHRGVSLETFSRLPAGDYRLRLHVDGLSCAEEVGFTVATYALAPLSAVLVTYALEGQMLHFTLAVDSFQQPYDEPLSIGLTQSGEILSKVDCCPLSPGSFRGALPISGEGPFALRIQACNDGEKTATVPIPGSNLEERRETVFNEFGDRLAFSLMPSPHSLPLRGGHLSKGGALAHALEVVELVTEQREILVHEDVLDLHMVCIDLDRGSARSVKVGHRKKGTRVAVSDTGNVVVVVGCFVGGEPFEGYTTFLQPTGLELKLTVPETEKPGETLTLRLSHNQREPLLVLVGVRDRRLASSRPADVALAGSLKSMVGSLAAGFGQLFTVGQESDGVFAGGLPFAEAPMVADCAPPDSDGCPSPAGRDVVENARTSFPEVVYWGLVEVSAIAELAIRLPDNPTTYSVEAFALKDGDWCRKVEDLVVDKPIRADLILPAACFRDDRVGGRLRIATRSGKARVHLQRDGEVVPLDLGDGALLTPLTLDFPVMPGIYTATVSDPVLGDIDSVRRQVSEPGKFRGLVQEVALLQPGHGLSRDEVGAVRMRLLPSLESTYLKLLDSTADYRYFCSEQTAAKILASTLLYSLSRNLDARFNAEKIILAGVEREKLMVRDKGLAMYPHSKEAEGYWGPLAVAHLWDVGELAQNLKLTPALSQAMGEISQLADAMAEAYGLSKFPKQITGFREAWQTARADPASASNWVADHLKQDGHVWHTDERKNGVKERVNLSYAAAVLLKSGEVQKGISVGAQVLRQLNEQGRLYSTYDSLAAACFMGLLCGQGLLGGPVVLEANGRRASRQEALALEDRLESLRVEEGLVAVALQRLVQIDWADRGTTFPFDVAVEGSDGSAPTELKCGRTVFLCISLPEKYKAGDLAHIYLPPCLTRLQGGGSINQFSLDFEGRNRLRVPLAVIKAPEGPQRFAVCVRNMFEEERISCRMDLTIG